MKISKTMWYVIAIIIILLIIGGAWYMGYLPF